MKSRFKVKVLIFFMIPLGFVQAQTDVFRSESLQLLEKGEAEKAVEKMAEAVKMAPEIAENWFVLGKAHNAMKNGKAALVDFQKADSLKLASAEFYLIYGNTFFDVGNNKEAFKFFEKGIKIEPKNFELYFNRALVWIELQRPIDAIEDLSESLEHKPEFTEARMLRVTLNFENEEFDKCIKDCDYMIELDPKKFRSLLQQSFSFWRKRQ